MAKVLKFEAPEIKVVTLRPVKPTRKKVVEPQADSYTNIRNQVVRIENLQKAEKFDLSRSLPARVKAAKEEIESMSDWEIINEIVGWTPGLGKLRMLRFHFIALAFRDRNL
jgi:hypothetical protein